MITYDTYKRNINYIPVYEYLIKYYPIGINFTDPYYYDYSGIKKLKKIYGDKLKDNNNYFGITYKDWNNFEKVVKDRFQEFEVNNNTFLFQPSYGISIQKVNKTSNFFLRKNLMIYVSVIAPFYTIIGRTSGRYIDKLEKLSFTPNVTISPHNEYESSFIKAKKLIEKSFPNFIYLPHLVWGIQIEGLYVENVNDQETIIFHALFAKQDTNCRCFGDRRYEMKDWAYKNSQDR